MSSPSVCFRNKSVLITGASSGIGEELALQLAQAGAQLTLAARRTDRLETLAQKIAGRGTEETWETNAATISGLAAPQSPADAPTSAGSADASALIQFEREPQVL